MPILKLLEVMWWKKKGMCGELAKKLVNYVGRFGHNNDKIIVKKVMEEMQ